LKSLLKSIALLVMALTMVGCVQMHMDTEIKKDGSGEMDMTLSLSKVLTDAIAEMGTEGMDDDIGNLDGVLNIEKKDLEKSIKKHDVKLKKFKRSVVDGKETLAVTFQFKDLKGLSFAMGEVMGENEGGMAIIDIGNGQYALRPYNYQWPEKAEAEEAVEEDSDEMDMDDMDPEKMQKQMELMGKLMGAMGELDVSMKITVPGDIVESNAPLVEDRTSIWTINASNMMSGGGNMEPNIIFSSKGLKLKAEKE